MEKEKLLEEIRNSIVKKEEKEELVNILPRNRKRKTEPRFPEFQEYCKQRIKEGNPITADEVFNMFKRCL